MQHPNDNTPDPIKPDLKHDSMEYSAATDGDDILDTDKETDQEIEEESITAEELEYLEADKMEDKAEALNTAETDSEADEDNFINVPEEIEELDEDEPDEEHYEGR